MNKIKLKEIANIYNGYSNKLQPGNQEISIVGIKEIREQKAKKDKFLIRKDAFDKLLINDKTILISSIKGANVYEYGKKFNGAVTGKNLYKIELTDESIPVEYLMSVLQNNIINLPYEGSTIKLLKIKDLENCLIPILSKKLMESIVNMQKYKKTLKNQDKAISLYIESIIKEAYGNNN